MSEASRTRRLPDGARPRALQLPGARLVVARGPDRGRSLKITREEVVVGTGPSADLRLTDPTVSRNHLSLRRKGDAWLASDLDSTNGTRLDGRRIRAAYVDCGDALDVGATRLKLEAVRGAVELPLSTEDRFGRLVGKSPQMRRLFAMLADIAAEDATVLVSGETGVGKDAVAEALHEASPRKREPFVVVDCGAIAESLVDSELFGHVKGAFTGARSDRRGALVEAGGGTLFIDEIGELPRALQPKLLGALERREVRPLGSATSVPFAARVVAATNRDLKLDVNRGLFREDLFYRLNVIAVTVPPLRERPEDIPLLANMFWREVTGDADGACPDELLRLFTVHLWPGNVRELRNRVERAVILRAAEITGVPAPSGGSFRAAKEAAVNAFERGFLTELLERTRGNVSEAARRADMDRVYLIKLLRKHRIKT